MGFLDTLLGRTKPVGANLDRLFALPGAAVTLEAAEDLHSTKKAAVCFKPAVGQGFTETEKEFASLLNLDSADGAMRLSEQTDAYGYRWVVVEAADVDELVTRVHFVNSTLNDHGYGPQLLCSVFGFRQEATSSTGLGHAYFVYLFKRGTFYPFAPTGHEQRDNEAELRLRSIVGQDLAIEGDLDRWFPLWDLPID